MARAGLKVALARLALRAMASPKTSLAIVVGAAGLAGGLAVAARRPTHFIATSYVQTRAGRFAVTVSDSEWTVADRILVFEPGEDGWIGERLSPIDPTFAGGFGFTFSLSQSYLATAALSNRVVEMSTDGALTRELRSEQVQVFRHQDGCSPATRHCWVPDATLLPWEQPVRAGSLVAIDGENLAVRSWGESNQLALYHRSSEGWQLEGRRDLEQFDSSMLSLRDGRLLLSILGVPTVIERGEGDWAKAKELVAPLSDSPSEERPRPGQIVSVESLDLARDRAIVSYQTGIRRHSVHLFSRGPDGHWSWEARLAPGAAIEAELAKSVSYELGCEVEWGTSVSIDETRAIVGLRHFNCPKPGIAAVIFERGEDGWKNVDTLDFVEDFRGVGFFSPFSGHDGLMLMGMASWTAIATLSKDGEWENPRWLDLPKDFDGHWR